MEEQEAINVDPDVGVGSYAGPLIKLVGPYWLLVFPAIICACLSGAAQLFFFTLLGVLIEKIATARTPSEVTYV